MSAEIEKLTKIDPCTPILKWVGGKRLLLNKLQQILGAPAPGSRYFEPFVGGGSVAFSQVFNNKMFLSDLNSELINLYEIVRDKPKALIRELEKYENTSDFYYRIRELDRSANWMSQDSVKRAARVLYLNKTCFNGIYRVNSKGHFNTPYGNYKNPNFSNKAEIDKLHTFLNSKLEDGSNRIVIEHGNYLKFTAQARKGDLVYLDPPYFPVSATESFTAYQESGFNKIDHQSLRDECLRLLEIGAKVVVSNSNVPEVLDRLFSDKKYFRIHTVDVSRSMGGTLESRKKTTELIIEGLPRI